MTDNGDSMTGGSGPDGDGGALESWLRTEGPKKLPSRVLEDGAQFGRFRVLGLLGRGASAEVLRARSEPDGAVVALKVPRDPGDKTAARDPGRHALALARASSNLGVQLGELGMGEEAISAFDEALPVFRQHAASGAPCDSANYARALAWRADALRRFGEGRAKEALRDFDEAIGILRKLAENEPGAYRPHLARAVENRALALHDAGDREGALAGLDEALALFEASERAEHGSCAGDIANARHNKRVMIGATGTDV